MKSDCLFIEGNLAFVLDELRTQPEAAIYLSSDCMSYEEQLAQLSEWLQSAGEYGLAYECMVSMLENMPLKLSGAAVVKLLEVGLIFGFKTEADVDKKFDRR